jgi:hypothetical protein
LTLEIIPLLRILARMDSTSHQEINDSFRLLDPAKELSTNSNGNMNESIGKFGGADQFRNPANQLQLLLYEA